MKINIPKEWTEKRAPSEEGCEIGAGSRVGARIRCVVTRQGGPILNEGYVVSSGENVVAIEIDMRSKRCEVTAESAAEDGVPIIWLDGTNALHLKKGHEKEETEVAFPDYKGWRIFSAHVCRYTFRVCFVRDGARDPATKTHEYE